MIFITVEASSSQVVNLENYDTDRYYNRSTGRTGPAVKDA